MASEHDMEAAQIRGQAFVGALPTSWVDLEGSLPTDIARDNASARRKIRKIYRLIDQIAEVRAPQVACAGKCADCSGDGAEGRDHSGLGQACARQVCRRTVPISE